MDGENFLETNAAFKQQGSEERFIVKLEKECIIKHFRSDLEANHVTTFIEQVRRDDERGTNLRAAQVGERENS